MAILKPKDFIKDVLIDELGGMIGKHPFISFIMLGVGIEFLGKCIDGRLADWSSGRSSVVFENAIKTIPSLKRYEQYLTSHELYGSFRCGLAHAVSPKYKITLSSKQERGHLLEDGVRLNLKVEDFYDDFKLACTYVIGFNFPVEDKMNKDFLEVPSTDFKFETNIPTYMTSGYVPTSGSNSNPPAVSGAAPTTQNLI